MSTHSTILHNPNSNEPLFATAESGKPLTLSILSIGLASYINKTDKKNSPRWTPLDRAIHSGRAHMQRLAYYKPGAAHTKALEQNLVYDKSQGTPARAAESYRSFPEIIRIIRDAGAKQTCQLEGIKGDYTEQPRD
ncbi:hypothetical protein N7447_004532 [Penicillium robsamsonii]|uniref:uncharacterized protein n=1 Tax=Penicillium robsamsonii TaxID=1792511 RepID=UPI002548A4D8|nr:uncharacterized protein N7447_004532 [Penicillium robsamsonii]KAJ5827769.1 hypothetical protein N7447_004532 [Penicillium robsamsonii]